MIRLSLEQADFDTIIHDLSLLQTFRDLALVTPSVRNAYHIPKVRAEHKKTAAVLERLRDQTELQSEVTQVVSIAEVRR